MSNQCTRKIIKTLINMALVFALIGSVISMVDQSWNSKFVFVWPVAISMLCLGAAFLVSIIFWRCPSCGKHLGRIRDSENRSCPFCGERLR